MQMNNPSPRFEVTFNNTKKEVFMSFGLVNTIAGMFEDMSQLTEAFTNPHVRGALVVECLSERNENGGLVKEIDLNTLGIETEHLFEFLTWVEAHVSDFFTQSLVRATSSMRKKAQGMKEKP